MVLTLVLAMKIIIVSLLMLILQTLKKVSPNSSSFITSIRMFTFHIQNLTLLRGEKRTDISELMV